MEEQAVHARRWWALTVMCLGLMAITLDNSILNVAIPELVRDLGASTSQLQWIVDGYILVFAGLLLTTGSLGDRFGRKGALMIGLTLFGVGSFTASFAGSANQLIFTRAFMGIGAALIMPATLSLLTNVFPDPKERGRAIGVWAAVAGAGGALGPLLGGSLLRHFWWGSVFLINVPITIAVIVAGHYVLPTSRDPEAAKLDPVGALLSVAGLVAVLWGIIEAPSKGWSDQTVLGMLVTGVAIIAGFVWWELHSSHPMLDVRFFQNPRFTAANSAITMIFFAMYGSMFLMTQYLQTVIGYSPLEAGVRMLPMAAVMLLTAPTAPRIVERLGTKLVVGSGMLLAALGMFLMSTTTISSGYAHLVLCMAIMSGGMGLVMAPATESVMGSLPPSKAGVGSAMNDTTRQMGGALGVAVIGSLLATVYRPGVTDRVRDLGLSPSVLSSVQDSVGGAVDVAARLPAATGRALADAARIEYVHGLDNALKVGVLAILVAAAVVFAWLPARAGDAREPVAAELDGLASLTFAEAEGVLEVDAVAEREGVPS